MTGVQIIVPRNLPRSLLPASRPSGSVSRQDESRPDPSSPSSFLFLLRPPESSRHLDVSYHRGNSVTRDLPRVSGGEGGGASRTFEAPRFLERPRAGNLPIRSVFQENPFFTLAPINFRVIRGRNFTRVGIKTRPVESPVLLSRARRCAMKMWDKQIYFNT